MSQIVHTDKVTTNFVLQIFTGFPIEAAMLLDFLFEVGKRPQCIPSVPHRPSLLYHWTKIFVL